MHVVVYEPSTDAIIMSRRIDDDEPMDHRTFAEHVSRQWGGVIDDGPGHIPSCCGDIRVEFREDPDNAVVIWSGRSFFLTGHQG